MTRGSRSLLPEERADEQAVYQRIGDNIRYWRLRRDLTQQQLADQVLLTRSSIANIETGRQQLTVAALLSIADALSVEPGELL